MNTCKMNENSCLIPYGTKFGTIVNTGKFQIITTKVEEIPTIEIAVAIRQEIVKCHISRDMALYFENDPAKLIGADVVALDTLVIKPENNKLKYEHSYSIAKITLQK